LFVEVFPDQEAREMKREEGTPGGGGEGPATGNGGRGLKVVQSAPCSDTANGRHIWNLPDRCDFVGAR